MKNATDSTQTNGAVCIYGKRFPRSAVILNGLIAEAHRVERACRHSKVLFSVRSSQKQAFYWGYLCMWGEVSVSERQCAADGGALAVGAELAPFAVARAAEEWFTATFASPEGFPNHE